LQFGLKGYLSLFLCCMISFALLGMWILLCL
jgi:hypothetical protein